MVLSSGEEHVSELIVGNRELPPPDTWTFPQVIWCQEYENETWLVGEDEVKAAVYVVRGDAEFSEFKPLFLVLGFLPFFARFLNWLTSFLCFNVSWRQAVTPELLSDSDPPANCLDIQK